MSGRSFPCMALVCAAIIAVAGGTGAALADPAPPPPGATVAGERKPLHWRCWYNQHAHIHCLLDSVAAERATATATDGTVANGQPPILGELRQRPSSFKSLLVRIPVYGVPHDDGLSGTLAVAIMCGRRSDCSVHYSHRVPPHQEIATILHRHLGWPGDPSPPTALAAARIEAVASASGD